MRVRWDLAGQQMRTSGHCWRRPYIMIVVLQLYWERLIPPWTHILHQAPSLVFLLLWLVWYSTLPTRSYTIGFHCNNMTNTKNQEYHVADPCLTIFHQGKVQCAQSTRKTYASYGWGGWRFELCGYQLKSILFYLVTPDCLYLQLGHFKSRIFHWRDFDALFIRASLRHFVICIFSALCRISFTNCKLVLLTLEPVTKFVPQFFCYKSDFVLIFFRFISYQCLILWVALQVLQIWACVSIHPLLAWIFLWRWWTCLGVVCQFALLHTHGK